MYNKLNKYIIIFKYFFNTPNNILVKLIYKMYEIYFNGVVYIKY